MNIRYVNNRVYFDEAQILAMVTQANVKAYCELQKEAISKGYCKLEAGKQIIPVSEHFPGSVIGLCLSRGIIPSDEFLGVMASAMIQGHDYYQHGSPIMFGEAFVFGSYHTDKSLVPLHYNVKYALARARNLEGIQEQSTYEKFARDWTKACLRELVKTKGWNAPFLPLEKDHQKTKREKNENYHFAFMLPPIIETFSTEASPECFEQVVQDVMQIIGKKDLVKIFDKRIAIDREIKGGLRDRIEKAYLRTKQVIEKIKPQETTPVKPSPSLKVISGKKDAFLR